MRGSEGQMQTRRSTQCSHLHLNLVFVDILSQPVKAVSIMFAH